jgi:hypothetical protein
MTSNLRCFATIISVATCVLTSVLSPNIANAQPVYPKVIKVFPMSPQAKAEADVIKNCRRETICVDNNGLGTPCTKTKVIINCSPPPVIK